MTVDIILVFVILGVTIVLFAFEIFPVDKIAFFIIVSLALLGLVSPEEAISGFSNSATIAVMALMMLAIAMEANGVINWMVSGLGRVRSLPMYLMAPVFMLVTATISAFISTTAVVIVFIKIVNQLADKYNISQSKLLLPISFAGILGGTCTLMGTSTNLIVNSVARNLGAPKLGFFEFTGLGLIFLGVSVLYLTITLRWLPWGKNKNIREDYQINNYITEVTIHKDSELIGRKIEETFFYNNPEISLLKLTRENRVHNAPGRYITLREDDTLLLMCDIENLSRLNASKDFTIHDRNYPESSRQETAGTEPIPENGHTVFVELLMLNGSALLGKTLGNIRKFMIPDVIPIAIKKRITLTHFNDRLIRSSKNKLVLKPGDRLLVEVEKDDMRSLELIENVVILQEFEQSGHTTPYRRLFSLGVLILVIALAASGMLSILISALTGVAILLLTGNLDLLNVYSKVNWQIIFLLAGMIPLGVAMHNTGADMWLSDQLLELLGGKTPVVIIGTLFIITMGLSGVVSNNATAVIMTPIAVSLAHGLHLEYKPFILAVMFAASFSFFTPVGYQTNTLIYGIGNYNFKHFLLIGGILSIILWLLGTLLLERML